MKKIIFFAAILFSAQSLAQGSSQNSQDNFANHKAKIIENLNKEKAIIDSEISCINSASSKEDGKKCRDQKKAQMDALRSERKDMRQDMIEKRREKLNEKISEKSAEKVE